MGALNGVKVLDLSRILAGPYAAQMLSDLGADVVKIEAPWGDDTRGWGPPFTTGFDGEDVAAYFLSCNRGKEIRNMNIKQSLDELRELIKESDVVIENFLPGTLSRIVGDLPEDVIVCSISGFGATGPRSNEPGYDLALQARSGIMSITGNPNVEPSKVGVAWIDVITGLNAVSAILTALFHKERTGEAQNIDISLWDCAIAALVNQAQNQLASGIDPSPMGSAHPNLVPYRAFEAKDGWFVIAVGNDTQWEKLCSRLGLEKRFVTNRERVENRELVEDEISKKVSDFSRKDLENMLEGIPCSPVNSVSEALNDEQSLARGVIWNIGDVPTLANPLRFMSKTPASHEY